MLALLALIETSGDRYALERAELNRELGPFDEARMALNEAREADAPRGRDRQEARVRRWPHPHTTGENEFYLFKKAWLFGSTIKSHQRPLHGDGWRQHISQVPWQDDDYQSEAM